MGNQQNHHVSSHFLSHLLDRLYIHGRTLYAWLRQAEVAAQVTRLLFRHVPPRARMGPDFGGETATSGRLGPVPDGSRLLVRPATAGGLGKAVLLLNSTVITRD
jgi:hypothetical protein